MRYLGTALAYVVALTLTAAVASLVVLFLVGPHGGVLPASWYVPILSVAWIAVLFLPIFFARWMWRRLGILKRSN